MYKNKILSLFVLSISLLLSCNNDEVLIDSNSVTHGNLRVKEGFDLNRLAANSLLIDEYYSADLDENYNLFNTSSELFLGLTKEGVVVEGLVQYEKKGQKLGFGTYNYSEESNILTFDLFNSFEDLIKGNVEKTFITNDFYIKDLMYVRDFYFPGSGLSCFFSDSLEERVYDKNYNDLALDAFFRKIPEPIDDYAGCGWTANCLKQNGNNCVARIRTSYCITIDPGICRVADVKTFMVENNYDDYLYYITDVILDDKYYLFRDDYMRKSELGRFYEDIFYNSSGQFLETLDLTLVSKILNVLPLVNDSIDTLFVANDNQVVIDNQLKDMLFEIADYSISKTSSAVYIDILNQFKTDVENMFNKIKSELDIYLNVED